VLRALARPLAGFARISSRSKVAGIGLAAAAVATLEEVRVRLGAPPFRAVLQTEVAGTQVVGSRPITVAVGPRVAELPAAELAFLGGRALEEARAGTFIAATLPAHALTDLLRAVAVVLGGQASAGGGELDRAVAAWLSDPEQAALLSDEGRPRLVAALEEVLSAPAELEARLSDYLRGCRFTADRLGLLACGSPVAALRALAAVDGATGPDGTAALGELVAFLLSPAYRSLVS
jgi:hypothetical protein